MKTIYNALLDQLQDKVKALKWIDLDFGQLEQIRSGERPPIAYPCALITIGVPRCRNLTDTIQNCQAQIIIRLAFDPLGNGRTAANAPDDVRDTSLNPYDVISDVHAALQGYETENFNSLARSSQEKESRTDRFIYKMVYTCDFEDQTAD
ncbi:hypothetical protein LJC38_00145 [Parabacteroides sp. OttesenSCG-928-K15]|nr:hypothetical protein [Parabacteroides sp. OttesenSCG-928-K15]